MISVVYENDEVRVNLVQVGGNGRMSDGLFWAVRGEGGLRPVGEVVKVWLWKRSWRFRETGWRGGLELGVCQRSVILNQTAGAG